MIERAMGQPEKVQDEFEKFSALRTQYLLESFGYGKNMMLIDSFYFNKENKYGVGVVDTSKRCDGHNSVFRGIDLIEATAQTRLLLDKLLYEEKDMVPLFKGVKSFTFFAPVPQGSIVNVHIDRNEDEKKDTGVLSKGRIYLGENLVSEGIIEGTVVNRAFFEKYMEREIRKASKSVPKFPTVY